MSASLRKTRLVITGAANGVGKSLARTAAHMQIPLLLVDTDKDQLREVGSETGGKVIVGSVCDPAIVERIRGELARDGDSCMGLVNNAANMRRSCFGEVTQETFNAMMSVNVVGPLLLAQALIDLLESGRGKVVNIGSRNAYGGEETLLEYSISKASLACMTKNLAPTFAKRGVTICQVNPGWVLTEKEIQRKVEEGWPEDWHLNLDPARAPFGRLLAPEEVAEFVMFLFNPACAILNGSVIDFVQKPI